MTGEVSLPALLVSLSTACGTPSIPAPPPPAAVSPSATVAPSGSTAPPVASAPIEAPRPTRAGECAVRDALTEYMGTESPTRCGDLGVDASGEEDRRARDCVLASMHAERPFVVTMELRGLDSRFVYAYAGRRVGSVYEVRWFSYDSCPSGCGDDDPAWWSYTCGALVDLRAACPKRKSMSADDGLMEPCLEASEVGDRKVFADRRKAARRRLELWCDHAAVVASCPAALPSGR